MATFKYCSDISQYFTGPQGEHTSAYARRHNASGVIDAIEHTGPLNEIIRHGLGTRLDRVKDLRLKKERLAKRLDSESAKRIPPESVVSRSSAIAMESKHGTHGPEYRRLLMKFLGAVRAAYEVHHNRALKEWDDAMEELENNKVSLEKLEVELAASEAERSASTEELAGAQKRHSELQKELEVSHEKLARVTAASASETETLHAQLQQNSEALKSVEQESRNLRHNLEATEENDSRHKKEAERLHLEFQAKEGLCKLLWTKNNELSFSLERTQGQLDAATMEVSILTKECDKAKDSNTRVVRERDTLRTALQNAVSKSTHESVVKQLSDTLRGVETLSADYAIVNGQLTELDHSVHKANGRVAEVTKMHAELQTKYCNAQRETSSAKKELEFFKNELQSSDQKLEILRQGNENTCRELNDEMEKMQRSMLVQGSKMEVLARHLQSAKAEVVQTEQHEESLRTSCTNLERKVSDLVGRQLEMEFEIQERNSECRRLDGQLQPLKRAHNALKEEWQIAIDKRRALSQELSDLKVDHVINENEWYHSRDTLERQIESLKSIVGEERLNTEQRVSAMRLSAAEDIRTMKTMHVAELQEMEERLASLNHKLQQKSNKELIELKNSVLFHKNKISLLENERVRGATEIKEYEATVAELVDGVAKLQSEVYTMRDDHSDKVQRLNCLITSMESNLEQHQTEFERFRATSNDVENELQYEINCLEQKVQDQERELLDMESTQALTVQEFDGFRLRNQRQCARVEDLEHNMQTLATLGEDAKRRNRELSQDLDVASKELDAATRKVSALTLELDEKKRVVAASMQKILDRDATIVNLGDKNSLYQKSCQVQMDESKWWKLQHQRKSDAVLRAESAVEELQRSNKRAGAQVEKLSNELQESQERVDDITSRAEQQQTVLLLQISGLKDDVKTSNASAYTHYAQSKHAQADTVRLRSDLDALGKKLQEMEDACGRAKDVSFSTRQQSEKFMEQYAMLHRLWKQSRLDLEQQRLSTEELSAELDAEREMVQQLQERCTTYEAECGEAFKAMKELHQTMEVVDTTTGVELLRNVRQLSDVRVEMAAMRRLLEQSQMENKDIQEALSELVRTIEESVL